jgi:hypothetical protein
MLFRSLAPAMALLSLSIGVALAATPDQPSEQDLAATGASSFWSFNGGEASLRFNTSYLEVFGIGVDSPGMERRAHDAQAAPMAIRSRDGIQFSASAGTLDRFLGGVLHVDGRFALTLPGGESLQYDGFQLRVDERNPLRWNVIGDDGRTWLYVNHLMYKLTDDGDGFFVRSADLRIAPALAQRLKLPQIADGYIAELKLTSELRTRGPGDMGAIAGGDPNFHGDPHPDGGTYEADVLMENYTMSFSRCRQSTGSGTCDGNGPDDGEVVFTPSSTLRNTNRPNTADIPWYQKFTGWMNPYGYPYPNADQHPYLIWNLYRIVDGQLEQIGASGVKHAFLTVNVGCAPGANTGNGHILGKNCGDTYGTGNNDSPWDLGPRHELVPATGYWGRCGSIFDTDCDGSEDSVSTSGYRDRLIVRESQLSTPGAEYFSESWYIVQDDIDIYNTMMHRPITPGAGSGGWTPGSQGTGVLGPLIDRWVDPKASPHASAEIDAAGGHAKVAVKVKTLDECPAGSGLSGTCYRYDYVVHNFDFGNPVYGEAPNDAPPDLRVVSNLGFGAFRVPAQDAAIHVGDGHFADIDIDPANDWTATVDDGGVTWTAPAGNELNWGTLYRFSFVTDVEPDPESVMNVGLTVAGDESEVLKAAVMVPKGMGYIFVNGFEPPQND